MIGINIRRAQVTRYVTPLREGGSLPAIVEADDGFPYVLKFRGAGQGKKALIAELVGGELARRIGLQVPELVFLDLDDTFSKTEPDEEIQDLLRFSVGLNLGLHFLSGAMTYDPLVSEVDPVAASRTVLLDSLITNIDRTPRNPNLLMWSRSLWLIDHGACLYFHHNWQTWQEAVHKTFPAIHHHVLLKKATALEEAEGHLRTRLIPEVIREILDIIPDEWLIEASDDLSPDQKRMAYQTYLTTRIERLDLLTKEAEDARQAGL